MNKDNPMTLRRVQRWFTLFCIGLLGITSFSTSAQDFEEDPRIVVTSTRRITYVALVTDGTTDIHVMEFRDEMGLIDQDNDPTTPPALDPDDYTITNVTNTPGVNESDPQFSWDGSLIVYRQEMVPDFFSLYVVESDGENPVQITPNGVNVLNATFSPDGTQVAFSAQWGSSQYKIYRSDINGENQFTLTNGEGFNAAFPLWRVNANGEEEIAYLRAESETTQIVGINPLTAEVLYSTALQNQAWMLQPFAGAGATFIQRENSDADWEVAIINLETREITQLTNNDTNDCCAVALEYTGDFISGSLRGSPAYYLPAYYLSDTEDGGRDIFGVNLDGSNPFNLTANDDREYTSIIDRADYLYLRFDDRANASGDSLYGNTLLVGYNEIEDDRTVPRLGFSYSYIPGTSYIPSTEWEFQGNYDYDLQPFTQGSDPDVVDPISLQLLEGLAAAGVLQACEYSVASGETNIKVYSEPRESAPVVRSLIAGDTVQVNGWLPGGLSIPADWLHLTDGTWVKKDDLEQPADCRPPVPTINRYSL